jgi:hypothetical protein
MSFNVKVLPVPTPPVRNKHIGVLGLIWHLVVENRFNFGVSSCCWEYASCQGTLVQNYEFFEFQNGEYNKTCSLDQFSISLYLL